MKIVVCGPPAALSEAGADNSTHCTIVEDIASFTRIKDADAFINLHEDASDYNYDTKVPVIINSVLKTLPGDSTNLYRINGWPGFLQRNIWEVAGKKGREVSDIFTALGKQVIWIADEPGFVSARVIAMIVNEAFFAIEDEVSTREEIDTAMKLGTGYPFGPFEWATIIGEQRIGNLLQLLSLTDTRYAPSRLISINQGNP